MAGRESGDARGVSVHARGMNAHVRGVSVHARRRVVRRQAGRTAAPSTPPQACLRALNPPRSAPPANRGYTP